MRFKTTERLRVVPSAWLGARERAHEALVESDRAKPELERWFGGKESEYRSSGQASALLKARWRARVQSSPGTVISGRQESSPCPWLSSPEFIE